MMTIADLNDAINAAFPGKLVGLAANGFSPPSVVRYDWAPGTTGPEQTQIQNFVAAFDWNQTSPSQANPDGFFDALSDAVVAGQLPAAALQYLTALVRLAKKPVKRKALWAAIKGNLNAGQITAIQNAAVTYKMDLT